MARPKKTIDPIVVKRIKEARKNTIVDGKSMTQEQLARKLFVSTQAVKNWEQGINTIDDQHLQHISELCNVDYLWLRGMDAETIVQSTKAMLECNTWEEIPGQTLRQETRSYALVYSLLMCGYKIEDILNKKQYSEYMESSIRNSVEFYMTNLNKRKE